MKRLNKFLAEAGVGSRRKCDELISEGRVSVNDRVENKLGARVDERSDEVKVDGKSVDPEAAHEYILLNKPKGVVTTVSDEKLRKTVVDLIDSNTRLFPVGRLDIDTTGLLLLTNDGELTYRLTHPKFNVDKTYEVCLDSDLSDEDKIRLENGIRLEEGKTAKCRIAFPSSKNRRRVHLTIHQGWKRQIKRMFAHLGYHVLELKRIAMASLRLNGLAVGQWRKLTSDELNKLRTEIGLNHGNH